MTKIPVLISSPDASCDENLRILCVASGMEVIGCEDRDGAVAQALSLGRAVVIFVSSSTSACWSDVAAARTLRRYNPDHTIILIVTEGSEELAVAAMRSGVNDLLHREEVTDGLIPALRRLLGDHGPEGTASVHPIVGRSKLIRELRTYLAKVAAIDSNVLITGETGTGKELVADVLHRTSPRRDKEMIPVNCAAIPETLLESELFGHERGAFTGAHAARSGKFQLADGGTVFLDEIGDMDMVSQAKILRVVESKEVYTLGSQTGRHVNVRVVAATNQDPEQLVREKRFRQDLYFRLNVARVQLCPLRERKEDIGSLVTHFIQELNPKFRLQVEGCTDETLDLFQRYDWPGNVRELRNLLEATFISLDECTITPAHLPPAFHRRLAASESTPLAERDRMLSALSASNWNVSKAAEALKWSRMTMYRKIAKYHMSRGRDATFTPHADKRESA